MNRHDNPTLNDILDTVLQNFPLVSEATTGLHQRLQLILEKKIDLQSTNPGTAVVSALVDRDSPIKLRTEALQMGLHKYQLQVIKSAAHALGLNAEVVIADAERLTSEFIDGLVGASKVLPDNFWRLLLPNKNSREEQLQAACVVFNLFEPYLIKQMLELNISNREVLVLQLNEIKKDASLLQAFYQSIAYALELTTTGASVLSQDEILLRLFNLGPLFTKMLQILQGSGLIDARTEARKDLMESAGDAFQEGIAPPNEEELAVIISKLPPGLRYDSYISGATMAHVVKTIDANGKAWATKVLRPGIIEMVEDNMRMYNLLGEILIDCIEAYSQENPLSSQVINLRKAIPFFLKVASDDLQIEMDLVKEQLAQLKGAFLNNYPGLRTPSVNVELSNEDCLTMELIYGEKVSSGEAEPMIIRRLFTLAIALVKNRFWHGDLHPGNVKIYDSDNIVVYDWGKNIDLNQISLKPIWRLAVALIKQNAQDIAKAYCQAQSPEYTQVNFDDVLPIVTQIIEQLDKKSLSQRKKYRPKSFSQRKHESGELLQKLMVAVGLNFQSTIDYRYITFLRSSLAFSRVVDAELSKDAYSNRANKWRIIVQSIRMAVKDSGGIRKLFTKLPPAEGINATPHPS